MGQLAAGQCAAVRGLQRAGLVAGCIRLGVAGDVVVQAAVRTGAAVRAVAWHLRRAGRYAGGPARATQLGQCRFLGLPGLAPFQRAAQPVPAGEPAGGQCAGPARCTPPRCGRWCGGCRRRADRGLHGVRSGAGVRCDRRGVHVHAAGADVRIMACRVGHDRPGHTRLGAGRLQPGVLAGLGADRSVLRRRRLRPVLEPAHADGSVGRGDRPAPPARAAAAGGIDAGAAAVPCPAAGLRASACAGRADGRRTGGRCRRGRGQRGGTGHCGERSGQCTGHDLRCSASGHRRLPPGGEPRL